MSFQFWINLLIALVVLVVALLLINWSKFAFVRKMRAGRLRLKIQPKMKAIMPIILSGFSGERDVLFTLFTLKADLEELLLKADVLFEVEQLALRKFLTKLSSQIAKSEMGKATQDEHTDLILAGQLVVNELTELG